MNPGPRASAEISAKGLRHLLRHRRDAIRACHGWHSEDEVVGARGNEAARNAQRLTPGLRIRAAIELRGEREVIGVPPAASSAPRISSRFSAK